MQVIGGTFVLISGAAYFVFMAVWLNVFRLTGELRIVTTAAGVGRMLKLASGLMMFGLGSLLVVDPAALANLSAAAAVLAGAVASTALVVAADRWYRRRRPARA